MMHPLGRTIYLNSENWIDWKVQIHENPLEFGEAGRILRSKVMPITRMSCKEDRRCRMTGKIVTVDEYVAELATKVGDEDDEDAIAQIEAVVEREYPWCPS